MNSKTGYLKPIWQNKLIRLLLIVVLSLVLLFNINFNINCQAEDIQKEELSEGVYIEEIQINESEILTFEEIQELTGEYEGRYLTIADLGDLTNKINKLYLSKGYITARAVLPVQKISGGIVEIQLIEGRVGEIILVGNKDTRDSYLLKRISLKPGRLIKLDTLEDDLFYFNAVNDIRLQAELKAGKEFGTTDLILKAVEPKKTHYSIFVDNTGRGETGLYRYGINILNSSLLGYRDRLNLVFFGAEGMGAGTLSYSIPLERSGTRLNLNYNRNVTDIISGEYQSINIEGDYESYGLGISRPLLIREGFSLEGSLDFNKKVSDTYFSGVNLLTTDIETYNLGLTGRLLGERNVWNNSFSILSGTAVSGKDNYSDSGTADKFTKYSLYLENQRLLEDGIIFTFKTYLQATNNKLLPSSEQYSLGGMSTVRGYKEGTLIGDQGFFLSVELSKAFTERINYFVFLDHGGVYPYKGNEEGISNDDYLTGIGSGCTVNFTEKLSGKFVLGVPFNGEDNPHLHFALQWNL